MHICQQLVQETHQIEAGGYATDRPGQDVIEHQRGDGELRERRTHGFFHDTIDATAHEHAAALDVDRSNSEREHHDGEDEPRSCLADEVFGNCTRVECGRTHVVEDDGCRSPERNECEHSRGSDEYTLWTGCANVRSRVRHFSSHTRPK